MKKYSRILVAGVFGLAACGVVACSDDSSSSASANDDKKESGLQVFDAKGDMPSCDKFDGAAAQVIDEKAFFACIDDSWEQVSFSAPSYEQLPKCDASMNDFCVDITEGEKIEDSYICDEGEWVKGSRIDGFDGCFKGNENSVEVERIGRCSVKSEGRSKRNVEELSKDGDCTVLTFEDGSQRCTADYDDYTCSGNWKDGSCFVDARRCMQMYKPCLTPPGIRSYVYIDEYGNGHRVTEEYGGKSGHIENGVCVED